MSARYILFTALLVACADPVSAPIDATVRDVADAATLDATARDATVRDPRSDDEIARDCARCHSDQGDAWQHLSSHRLLHSCNGCHQTLAPSEGPGHQSRPQCDRCHSEEAHEGLECVVCHDPHGTANAYLLRARITLPASLGEADVHVTRPEGATLDGFVRQGVDGGVAGTGFCEVCHTRTAHYTRQGNGSAHHGELCSSCHAHATGFSAPDD